MINIGKPNLLAVAKNLAFSCYPYCLLWCVKYDTVRKFASENNVVYETLLPSETFIFGIFQGCFIVQLSRFLTLPWRFILSRSARQQKVVYHLHKPKSTSFFTFFAVKLWHALCNKNCPFMVQKCSYIQLNPVHKGAVLKCRKYADTRWKIQVLIF